MPINRITVFENYGKPSRKAKRGRTKTPAQKLFGDCSVSCRESAPSRGKYGPCLRACLRGGPKKQTKPTRKRAR